MEMGMEGRTGEAGEYANDAAEGEEAQWYKIQGYLSKLVFKFSRRR